MQQDTAKQQKRRQLRKRRKRSDRRKRKFMTMTSISEVQHGYVQTVMNYLTTVFNIFGARLKPRVK